MVMPLGACNPGAPLSFIAYLFLWLRIEHRGLVHTLSPSPDTLYSALNVSPKSEVIKKLLLKTLLNLRS